MKKNFLLAITLFYSLQFAYSQSGHLDPSFGNKGIVKTNMGSASDYQSSAKQVLIKSDGSIYILLDDFISKRLPGGSIDSSYGFDGYSRFVSLDNAYAALQADGKILIVGKDANNIMGIARLNSNGFPDSAFGTNGMQTPPLATPFEPTSIAIQSDEKIVVAGITKDENDYTYFSVIRLNTDGNFDNTFNGNGQVITDFEFKLPPERAGEDSAEFHNSYANSIAIHTNGKIIAGGSAYNGMDFDFAVARYNTDGSPDSTFDNDGRQTTKVGSNDDVGYALAIQSDGKIVLAGLADFGSNDRFAVVRYSVNGSPDNAFSGDGKQTVNIISNMLPGNSVAIQNGKIVVAGYTSNGNDNDFSVIRFNSNGSLDNSFDNDGKLTTDFNSSEDNAGSIAVQSDNKIVVAGVSETTLPHFALTRYNVNGSLDNTFDNDGKLEGDYKQGNTIFNSAAVQTDGKLVAAGQAWNGSNFDFAIARYKINGSPDSTFGQNGQLLTDFDGKDNYAYSVAIQTDGKILVAGNNDNINSKFAVARYNTDGTPDNTFSEDGKFIIPMGFADILNSVALQSDGKILLSGYTFTNDNYDSVDFALARLNINGTPDSTFSEDGKQLTDFNASLDFASAVAVQSDDKIIVSGRSVLNKINNFSLARYNTDGSLDTSFSHDGKQNNVFGPDGYFGTCLAIQTDNNILVGGFSETSSGSSSAFAVARYTTNGELDNTFSDDGFQSTSLGSGLNIGRSIAVNTDGRIAIGGTNDNYAIVMYNGDGSYNNNFSNDGIEITNIGVRGSSIQSLTFSDNRLYATGNGEFPGTLGVVARYIVPEGGPLPVSMMDFKAVLQNNAVILQWKIATEKNLSRFVIERSADGNSFLPINNISAGVSTSVKNYSATDEQPLKNINFYRLKIFDDDGKFTYSNIVAVKISGNNKLHLFPNPTKDILFVQADGQQENATIQIVDATGRKIKEFKVGLNNNTSFSINVNFMPKGIYNLVLRKKEKTEVRTFIKK